MGGFNYPLLVKLLYIIIILVMIAILHPEEIKKALKKAKIEDYFKKIELK